MYLLHNVAVTKRFTFPAAGHTIGIQLSKAGAAYADPSAGASNLTDAGGGVYTFALTATDTNTLGTLTYSLVDSSVQVSPLSGDIQDDVVASLASAKDLIPLSRAYQNLQGVTNADTLLSTLITSVSEAIRKYCRRDFVSASYDELYNGNGQRRLLLREYPIQSVQSVRYRPVTVLKITNTTAANVQARVSVTSSGLTLVRVNAGVKTTDTSVTFAGNVTLTAVAAAVNALGNGWSAQVVGDAVNYGGWPSADLFLPPLFGDGTGGQGALECVAGSFAELKMHTYELQGYQWDARGWLLRAIPYTDPELLHPEDLVWPTGINNFRIQYTAGYTTVPEAVQEACAEWVADLYFLAQRDPRLQASATGGGAVANYTPPQPAGKPPPGVANLLAPYRKHAVATGGG